MGEITREKKIMKKSNSRKSSDSVVLELVKVDPTLVDIYTKHANENAKELSTKQSKESTSTYVNDIGESLNVGLATSPAEKVSPLNIGENAFSVGSSDSAAASLTKNSTEIKIDQEIASTEGNATFVDNESLPLDIYALDSLNTEKASSSQKLQQIPADLFPASNQVKTFKEMLEQVQPRTQSSALPMASGIKMASAAIGKVPKSAATSVQKGHIVHASQVNQTGVKIVPQKVSTISPTTESVRSCSAVNKKPTKDLQGLKILGFLPASAVPPGEIFKVVPRQLRKQIVFTPVSSGQVPNVSVLPNQTSLPSMVHIPNASSKTSGRKLTLPSGVPSGPSPRMPCSTTVTSSSSLKNINIYDSAGNLVRRIISKNANPRPSKSVSPVIFKSTVS